MFGEDTAQKQRRWKKLDVSLGAEPVADRKLACCIPIQRDGEGSVPRVLLVSSRSTIGDAVERSLVFPKGGWEEHETVDEAAVREAFEEAGVSGRLDTPHVAVYEYDSEKTVHGVCRNRIVFVYILHVDVEYDDWPEKDARERYWMDLSDAGRRLKHEWMRAALDHVIQENGWTCPAP